MLELSVAYLTAATLIGGLFFLARRNQKQGWRKQRGAWGEVPSIEAPAVVETRFQSPLEHFSDLKRLQHALAMEKQVVQEEQLMERR